MESIKKLTELQLSVGYKEGVISPVALLGLVGESGEVLHTGWVVTDKLNIEIVKSGMQSCKMIDQLKKNVRDGLVHECSFELGPGDEVEFDKELADVLYYVNALAIARGKTLEDYAAISLENVAKKKAIKIG